MSIASKNLYELLGNDPELDPERKTPEVPTKAIDKPAARTGKRNAPAEAPVRPAGSSSHRGGQRDGFNANDNAFRDRGVGSDKNRSRGSGDPGEYRGSRSDGARGVGRGRGRGRGGAATGDRHSRTGIGEHEKQAGHGWGQQEGNAEWDDEKAGEAIAKADEKDEANAAQPDEAAEPAAEPEPEDKSKSYAAYLAELAEKKLSFAAENVRKPNEGSSKKFPEGKAIVREDEDAYIAGSAGKNKRERERKQKEFVELDDAKLHRETRDTSFRGGRGRGRGEFRGGEGRGRGGRGRGEGRGRGGRGGQSGPNVSDTSAFPSLGS